MELLTTTVTRTTIHIAMVDMHHMDMRPDMDMRPAPMGPMGLHMGLPMGIQTLSQSAPGASAPTTRRARLISRTTASGFNVRSEPGTREPGKRCRETLALPARQQSCIRAAQICAALAACVRLHPGPLVVAQ